MHVVNVEIKARLGDEEKVRRVLAEKKAFFKGKDHQVDTYFKINNGRLKLRQGNIENKLVYYDRRNEKGPKQSDVLLFEVGKDSDSLKKALSKALGVLVVVDKMREIYFVGNVKIHIDEVKGLGSFVEIEAIDENGSIGVEELRKQCEEFMKLFGIREEDLVPISYSDLLLKKKE